MPRHRPAARVARTASLLAATAGALVAAAPTAGRAQTRAFDVCVFGTFQTCSALTLTTAPVAAGTAVTVAVRQTTSSARATGLTALSFLFPGAPSPGGDAAADRPTLTASPGLALPAGAPLWTFQGQATRLDLLHDPVTPNIPASESQFVAGCAGGAFAGGLVATTLVTCAPGRYAWTFVTAARFSAVDVSGLGLELYAGTDDDAPVGRTVSCTIDAFAPPAGQCLDLADLFDPAVPFSAASSVVPPGVGPPGGLPPSVVPEPATAALAGAGLLVLAGATRRRRRGA